ncbi:AGAP001429-PA [Anopheles gambiae str. PEST]|uniref:TRAF3-interacting protein 1 n=1 Tax=Anopheles gambiae TaxID=7165 RepID=Q7PXJ3_ANOGA|nr:AGAP001429-PA [Anopheles gambiae str. PEST]
MASELDATVLKRTQSSLGKFVKRPALTEKLLRKPPFRFLHDIVHAIIREHGSLDGLYTADELNSDNIKDRDSKMAFLQKLIDVVKLTTGRELKVRPSKIVAGLEPERTNELLQALASILEEKLSTTEIVRHYLGDNPTTTNGVNGNGSGPNAGPETNGTKGETREEGKKSKQERVKEKPKESEATAVDPRRKDKNGKVKEKEVLKNGTTVKPVEKAKTKQNGTKVQPNDSTKKKSDKPSKGKEKEKSVKRISSIPEEPQPPAVPEKVTPARPEPTTNGTESMVNGGNAPESRKRRDSIKEFGEPVTLSDANGEASGEEEHEKRRQQQLGSNSSSRRSSLKKQNSLTPSENNALSEMNQFNGLQSSLSRQDSNVTVTVAAPVESKASAVKPPMHRQQSVETVMRPRTSLRPPSVRPPSARPGAPRRKEKNVEVILQPNETQKLGEINVKMEVFNSELLDDDGENLIVIEDPTTVSDGLVYGRAGELPGGAADETALLQSAEQEEQQGHLVQQILETQKEFSTHTGTDSELLRKADMEWTAGQRQSSARQMESLRESIQKLTRSVNPLGKLMDFIQEDIDSMERELASWQQIYTQSMVELNKERSATENAIEPLKQQLSQIEVNIKEYRDMIDTTRANILQNEAKIERLYMTEI